jgi:hypothetical protein
LHSKYVRPGQVFDITVHAERTRCRIKGIEDGKVAVAVINPATGKEKRGRWWLAYYFVKEDGKRVTAFDLEMEAKVSLGARRLSKLLREHMDQARLSLSERERNVCALESCLPAAQEGAKP